MDYDPELNYERGVEEQPPDQGPQYDRQTPPKKGSRLIAAGAILLIIGLVLAAIPLLWTNMKDISADWVGTMDEGYYESYDDGSITTVTGQITDEIPVNVQDNPTLYAQGYRFWYELDHVYEEAVVSKEDIGNEGDRVSLHITLELMNLGGDYYWIWTVFSKTDPVVYYTAGIAFLLVGSVVAGFGVRRRRESERKMQDVQPMTYESYQAGQPRRLEREVPRSVLSQKNQCTFCGAEMPAGDILCPKCGRGRFKA